MKKQGIFLTALIILALSSGCGKTQSVSETETTSEIENTVIEETEESTIETETEIASETETQSIEAETEPIATEEETEPETILPESETATVEEMAISEMDALMYAQANVNIRANYSKDSEKLGALQKGTGIKVTGVTADQNWYRVAYKEAEAFVAASYLGLEKPAEETPAPVVETPAPATPAPDAQAPAVETPAPPVEAPAPAETQQTPAPDAQASNPIPPDIGNGRALTNEDWNRMFEDPNFGRTGGHPGEVQNPDGTFSIVENWY